MKKFVFEYRCLCADYRLELNGDNLNEVLAIFAKIYTDIEKIYSVREMDSAEIISNLRYGITDKEYKNLMNAIKPR